MLDLGYYKEVWLAQKSALCFSPIILFILESLLFRQCLMRKSVGVLPLGILVKKEVKTFWKMARQKEDRKEKEKLKSNWSAIFENKEFEWKKE